MAMCIFSGLLVSIILIQSGVALKCYVCNPAPGRLCDTELGDLQTCDADTFSNWASLIPYYRPLLLSKVFTNLKCAKVKYWTDKGFVEYTRACMPVTDRVCDMVRLEAMLEYTGGVDCDFCDDRDGCNGSLPSAGFPYLGSILLAYVILNIIL